MYGTVAYIRIKPGMEETLQRQMAQARESTAPIIPGLVFQYAYKMDANPNEYYLMVGFESREAYVANAASPEQNERFTALREMMETDPEWHDGEIVFSYPAQAEPE